MNSAPHETDPQAPEVAPDSAPDVVPSLDPDQPMADPQTKPAPEPEGYDLTESDESTDGDMGVSSERVGPTGPGQVGTTGTRPVGPRKDAADGSAVAGDPPEQSAGGPETNPGGIAPKAGYPRLDPRS